MTGHVFRLAAAALCAAVLSGALAGSVVTAAPEAAATQPHAKCAGKVATKVGTAGPDRLVGTPKRDIIAGLGGNDVIFGLGGNDLVCGGPGHDRLFGGSGRDMLLGGPGRDRAVGGPGRDRLFGGAHRDALFGRSGPDLLVGGLGNDRLLGGAGIDTCYQNSGQGAVLQCELPAASTQPPTSESPQSEIDEPVVPPPPPLLDLTGILAIAYSDIDGRDGYSGGDVLIGQLVDSDGDKVPSEGDTVEMGRYPKDLRASEYGDWDITSHPVHRVGYLSSGKEIQVGHYPAYPNVSGVIVYFDWELHEDLDKRSERYSEYDPRIPGSGAGSWFIDFEGAGTNDRVFTDADFGSHPDDGVDEREPQPDDDDFLDVEILW